MRILDLNVQGSWLNAHWDHILLSFLFSGSEASDVNIANSVCL